MRPSPGLQQMRGETVQETLQGRRFGVPLARAFLNCFRTVLGCWQCRRTTCVRGSIESKGVRNARNRTLLSVMPP